jgi:hypothetical protein
MTPRRALGFADESRNGENGRGVEHRPQPIGVGCLRSTLCVIYLDQMRRWFRSIRISLMSAMVRSIGPPTLSLETALSNCRATKMRVAVRAQCGNRDDEAWIMAARLLTGKPLCDDGLNLHVPAVSQRARVASHPSAPSSHSAGTRHPWRHPEGHRSLGALGRNIPFRTRPESLYTPRAVPDIWAEWGLLNRTKSVRKIRGVT